MTDEIDASAKRAAKTARQEARAKEREQRQREIGFVLAVENGKRMREKRKRLTKRFSDRQGARGRG